MATHCCCLLFMLFSLLCCLLYLSMGIFFVNSLFLYDYTSDSLFHHLFHVCNQMGCISLQFFVIFFHFGMLLFFVWAFSYLFYSSISITYLSPNFVYDCISLWFFPFWLCWCLFYHFIVSSSFCHSSFVVFFGNFISFHFGMLLFLGVFLSFLLIHWYFSVSLTLCIIAFHCSLFLLVVVLSVLFICCSGLLLLFVFCHSFL